MDLLSHKKIMLTALKDLPQLKKHEEALSQHVQRPDLDDIGFCANKHYYFTPDEKNKLASFMDSDGKNNAKAAYETHVKYMKEALDAGKIDLALEQAGRASHFLQDMAQTQHITRTSTLGKAAELKTHLDFEAKMDKCKNILAINYYMQAPKKDLSAPRGFDTLFNDTLEISKNSEKVSGKNKDRWVGLAQKQFNTAVDATKEFMANFAQMLQEKGV